MTKKRVVSLLSGLMLTVFGVALTATPASAAYGDAGYVLAGTTVYLGPGFFYSPVYGTSYDAWIPLGCWTDDGQGRRWFSFAWQSQRWVQADRVLYQPSLPHC